MKLRLVIVARIVAR